MNVQHEKSKLAKLLDELSLSQLRHCEVQLRHVDYGTRNLKTAVKSRPCVVITRAIGGAIVYIPRLKPDYDSRQYDAAYSRCQKRAKLVRQWLDEYIEERGHNK